jgi:2-polyprenyl-3-methyl-5-hydroxy-6-metoxy-1,4-benzoquinol methylase
MKRDVQFDNLGIVAGLWKEMSRYLGDLKHKRVLDVGCNYGYYSWLLTQAGAKVIGVDNQQKLIEEARKNDPEATFYAADIEAFIQNITSIFNVTLFLNTFHHMIAKDNVRAWQCFHKLSETTELMIFMIKVRKGDLAQKHWQQNESKFISLVAANSQFTEFEKIVDHSVYKGRTLWAFC